MDFETIITGVGGTLILLLLSVIAFFMKKQYSKQDKTSDDVTEIKLILQQDSDALGAHKSNCALRHENLDDKIKKHDSHLERHDKEINALKSKAV